MTLTLYRITDTDGRVSYYWAPHPLAARKLAKADGVMVHRTEQELPGDLAARHGDADPDFTWGAVLEDWVLPGTNCRYRIIEFLRDETNLGNPEPGRSRHGRRTFHVDPGNSFSTVEEAMLFAMAREVTGELNVSRHMASAAARVLDLNRSPE